MAIFEDSMKILMDLEFDSPETALEHNADETSVTYMGIYKTAHPEWIGWKIVEEKSKQYEDIKELSVKLYENSRLTEYVYDFYRKEYYVPMRLTEVLAQHTADEIFVFAVNTNCRKAIKLTQELIGVTPDGVIGKDTLRALNAYDWQKFDKDFDEVEIKHYDKIVAENPNKRIYAKGWRNRALAV